MPVVVKEKALSPRVSTGSNSSAVRLYLIVGTDDEQEAIAALEAASDYDYVVSDTLLLRDTVTVVPMGDQKWDGVVRYASLSGSGSDDTVSFSTRGGTQHITQGLETTGVHTPPGVSAPDFKGAIGVAGDRVEGTDIVVPVYQFSKTRMLPSTVVTPAYRFTLFQLTGKVNNAPFDEFAAQEVLFLGAEGGRRGSSLWTITYNYAASPNLEDLVVGDITNIDKTGWDHLWVHYQETVDSVSSRLVMNPLAVITNRVYHLADLSALNV